MTKEEIKFLRNIEARLKKVEQFLEETYTGFNCQHIWENVEGTATSIERCKRCGSVRVGANNYNPLNQ